jgi:hypothetical protein
MKKKNIKGLSLKKVQVATIGNTVKGGYIEGGSLAQCSEVMSCITYSCPQTQDVGCSNHMCDSRLGGCKTYYCIQ